MSNKEDNNNDNNLKNNKDEKYNIIFEKQSEESDKEESKDSVDSDELDKNVEKMLNNPESFSKKRDFFSFYSKNRKSAVIQQKPSFNVRRVTRLNSQVVPTKPEFKKFSNFELKPRGFGVNKIKEKIEFFEKKALENKYKTLNLTSYQKTYYDNNELRQFNTKLFKIESINNIKVTSNKDKQNKKSYKVSEQHFSYDSNDHIPKIDKIKYKSDNKLNLNLVVDYSKIINSSKIIQKEKKLDLFMDENNNNNKQKEEMKKVKEINESSESSDSISSSKEVSTNFSHGMGIDQPIPIHNRQKSEICYYKDLLDKMSESEPIKKNNLMVNFKDDSNSYLLRGSKNNNKYIVVKKSDNKISLEKDNKLKNGIKKIYSENISDNMTLKKLDNAKFRLNQANNNKIIKRQILDMLDKLIIDRKIKNKTNLNSEKINNLYDKQKLIRAFQIKPQLSLIHQKINILLQNSDNSSEISNKDHLNEKVIRQSVSSIYFLDCIGLEPIILFHKQNKIENKKLINDIEENIELSGKINKKKYIKYYFQNLNKANLFFEILINTINHLQDTINIPINK